MDKFIGTGVALVTPFKQDKSVDFDALERLVNYQIDNGINYLVILGTTGEPATLNKEEQEAVKQKVVAVNQGRLPLIVGIGGNNTEAVVTQIKTTNLSDFDAILSVSPYYNKPTQEGIYQHFKAIAQASPKPIILYNVPGRTASNMLTKTVIRLANDFDNIIAIKEASGDIVQVMQLLKDKPEKFLVISGDDITALPITLAGASGVISVIGGGLPKHFSKLIALGLEGKTKEAYTIQYQIMESISLIFEEGNPAGIKALLQELKICTNQVRLPLIHASTNLQQRIKIFIENLKN